MQTHQLVVQRESPMARWVKQHLKWACAAGVCLGFVGFLPDTAYA
ncbi:MAG: hypothetical protein R3B89_14490 [Polyangiaceae bacterium]